MPLKCYTRKRKDNTTYRNCVGSKPPALVKPKERPILVVSNYSLRPRKKK